MELSNLTEYFRRSLIDSERLSPSDEKILPLIGTGKRKRTEDFVAVPKRCWLNGYLDREVAKHIISTTSKRSGKTPFSVETLLIPRIDLLNVSGGRINQNSRQILIPVLVLAKVDLDGMLTPSEKAPWIPRDWLSPSQTSNITVGDIDTVDKFVSANPYEGIDTWAGLIEYCDAMVRFALGLNCSENHDNELGLFDVFFDEQLVQSDDFLIQLDTPIVGAKDKILSTYDDLLEKKSFPQLYKRFVAGDFDASVFIDKTNCLESAKLHLGQMTGEFPLSDKQRNALHYFFNTKAGDILAVNGPPGTGKTTLLRSVVSDLWTKAALKQTEPPVIFAASNNNQAVTNILESFAKADEKGIDKPLEGRWLPEISSYGLYCCSSSARQKDKYHYFAKNDDTTMQSWQTRAFLDKATAYFLNRAEEWQSDIGRDVSQIKNALHNELTNVKSSFDKGFRLYEGFVETDRKYTKKYGSREELVAKIKEHEESTFRLSDDIRVNKNLYDQILLVWEERDFWINLFMWFPPIKKSQFYKNQRFVLNHGLQIEKCDDRTIDSWFQECLSSLKSQRLNFEKEKDVLIKHMKEWEATESELIRWLEEFAPKEHLTEERFQNFIENCDRVLRFKMFKLATHYWEAAWLEELKQYIDNNGDDKNSPRKIPLRFRRYAKIMPCMVSTFFMLPLMMTAFEKKDGVWRNIPLYETIDLLIVDEAGQALPDVSAASFALAKKAIVVGDTDQIEPVWSIPIGVDRSNLIAFDLLKSEKQFDEFWLNSGLMASCGNIMTVAQRQTSFHQFEQLQRGLYLTEHRRCYDDIISYCNDLIYQGVLEARRGDPKQEVPWGQLSFINSDSESVKYGGSRGNEGEAKIISDWLVKNYKKIVEYARQQDDSLLDKDDQQIFLQSVGIVTPFSKQADLIHRKIKAAGLPALTVGTVHALQGDEKLIVLFSSVYGINDKTVGKFYDMKPNMLNVAVSRAKDSFIVFGSQQVFGVDSVGSPSGMLRNRLKETNILSSLDDRLLG
ncbi:AAA domain-containing protein [Idiomarina sp.]|uniref:DEAD/DEAH box helicase n=1 Tax=Idiomarina sp. TaxID=1874361 RepID=UPI0025899818|nr:AAA domain-containing protein [Idiomarina sp.]